jgi:hypothetical protein
MPKKIDQKNVNKQTNVNVHPFKVGAQYHNRDGNYQVISIDEPNMVIRYQNGRTLESSIALQARIWENMQEGNDDDLDLDSM